MSEEMKSETSVPCDCGSPYCSGWKPAGPQRFIIAQHLDGECPERHIVTELGGGRWVAYEDHASTQMERDALAHRLARIAACAKELVATLPKCGWFSGANGEDTDADEWEECHEVATHTDYEMRRCDKHAPKNRGYGETDYAVPLRALLAALHDDGEAGR
jgi:hypothetical protein